MENKHEQLYVAVQDLLIELGITPKRLKDIATNRTHNSIHPKTAQKLIDAGLIVEEINWRKPDNVSGPNSVQEEHSEFLSKLQDIRSTRTLLLAFDKIKSALAPGILWSYLREKHPEFLFKEIKDYLFPSN